VRGEQLPHTLLFLCKKLALHLRREGRFFGSNMIDYAFPTMMAEKALKDLHYAMLNNNYDKALEAAAEALVQTKEAVKSIEHMRKNNS
jgi:hypothetical protein